jgi:aldehyde:ferredoxin oxidoreductase
MINHRLGLSDADDTLPKRWFEEPTDAGPFKGEVIDRNAFAAMKSRFYAISDFNTHGQPNIPWRKHLTEITTGFCISVKLPDMPGFRSRQLVLDQPVASVEQAIFALKTKHPELSDDLDDYSLGVSVNDELIVRGEAETSLKNGDQIEFVPVMTGG